MRTARLHALLVDALALGTAATAGCAASPAHREPPPPSITTSAPAAPAPPTASAPAAPPSTSPPGPASAPPPVVPTAAGSSEPGPGVVPGGPYQVPAGVTAACHDGLRNVLANLKPVRAFDYIELRRRFGGQSEPMMAHGRPCATAGSADACHEGLRKPIDGGFGSSCHPAHCDFHVVVTDASGVAHLRSPEEIARFLGPIDTPGEARLMAFAHGHRTLGCDERPPKRVGKAWQLVVNTMISECPIVTADVTLSIADDGSVSVLSTANRKETGACVGRRPPGLRAAGIGRASTAGAHLAVCAHLEAASVSAFERLGRELARLGAPARLSRLCRRAATDERRHARAVASLARSYGGRVPAVVADEEALRDATAVALDNAVEGCVRETFGALVGMHQARHAGDPRVRAAMRSLARDEVRHAALAWKIAAWLEPRLGEDGAERAARARRDAVEALRRELQDELPREMREPLGLPGAEASTRMLGALERTLWSMSPA